METKKYPSLNGLRALSILFVLCEHFGFHLKNSGYLFYPRWLEPLASFIQDGQLGVTVFFVISGFLITSLLLQEEQANGKISLKNFYTRRTLRIFPAYYFLLLTYFIFQWLGYIKISHNSWLTALTYTKYFNTHADWYIGHAWSLSIEEQFYLFWPMIFLLGNRARKIAAIVLILTVPLIRLYLYFYPIDWAMRYAIFVRIDSIAIGCLFAFYKKEIIEILTPYWKVLFYFSVITLFILRYLPDFASKIYFQFIFIPLGTTFGSIANILIAIILMYSVFYTKGNWFKFLNLKVLNYIGILSYSIYLWQQIFTYISSFWINQFPQNILLLILASLFSYYIIEKPFLKLKSKF
jgi:peptidoglycan/LPS O-acetylase OafA/YrhL